MELTLIDFVLFVLWGSFSMVLLFTMISRAHRVGSETHGVSRRVICRLCLYAFEVHGRERVVTCPHCGAATDKGRSRRLG